MAYGDVVRSVQWHPEFDAEISRIYTDLVAPTAEQYLPGCTAAFVESVRPLPDSYRIVRNFIEHFVHLQG